MVLISNKNSIGKHRRILRVLIVTSEWPSFHGDISGIHIVRQVEVLRASGVDVDVFYFRGKKNPLRYVQAIRQLHHTRINDYHLIHAHHGQSGIVALAQCQLPVVVTFHGSDLQGIRDSKDRQTLAGQVLSLVSRAVAFKADKIIIVSEHMRRFLPNKDYSVIPAGISLELFRPIPTEEARDLLCLPLDRYLILFVGDPARPEKRFDLAKIVTDKLQLDKMVELVVANGIEPDVMPLYMNACNLMLVTSSSEGSPSAVKEALACNLPIVSVDVGDVRMRIGSIAGCVMCTDDHPETIRAAVKRVLTTNQRIEGRITVGDLDERVLCERVIDVYQQVLFGKSGQMETGY